VPNREVKSMFENALSQRNRGRVAWRALAIASSVALALTACSSPGATPSNGDVKVKTINIGAVLPLTGATAPNGVNSLNGLKVAVKMINDAGGIKSMGGAKLVLTSADATSDPAAAASAAEQFLSKGTPPLAVFGSYASSLTATVARVTERAKVPLLSTSFSDDLTNQGYKYFFQVAAAASLMGNAQMGYANDMAKAAGRTLDKVAIVYANNAYGASQAAALKSQATALGKQIVLYEGYDPTITDAGPIVSKIMNAKADGIFSIAYVTDGVLLTRALKAAGNTTPIFGGTGGYVTADFQKALGDQVNGIFSVTTSNPEEYGNFNTAYEKAYGEFMPQEAHDFAALVDVLAQSLEENPTTDSTKLAENLHKGTFTYGAAGQMPGSAVKFDATGKNVKAAPLMVQWQKGNLVGVWPKGLVKGAPVWPSK
jgi:branched-chain amino acid transport system substrate-binding protein